MSRGAEILRAAKPYVGDDKLGLLEVMIDLQELMEPAKAPIQFLASEHPTPDLEGMLRAIREFCNDRERQMIDRILNFLMLRRILEIMNKVRESDADADGWEVLKNCLTKEQQQQFEMVQMMMTMMNTSESGE